jgi:hypothetical protein
MMERDSRDWVSSPGMRVLKTPLGADFFSVLRQQALSPAVPFWRRPAWFVFKLRDLTIFENPRWSETQMVTSLACASEWLERDTWIVSDSDIFYGADTIERLMESPADLTITYDPAWHAVWRRRFAADRAIVGTLVR